jgi:hypothetical protein
MPVVKRTAQAEEDLITLWLHIAKDNPFAADRLPMPPLKAVSAGRSSMNRRQGAQECECRNLAKGLPEGGYPRLSVA